MAKKKSANAWLAALRKSGIKTSSARDAMQTKGWLDSGNYALNWAISGQLLQGYPLGHCIEIFGDPATGKSLLATRAMAMMQQSGGVAYLDDPENAYNAKHAEVLGVNVDELAMPEVASETVADHLANAEGFVEGFKQFGAERGIIVLDSIAQLSTAHELKVKLEKRDMSKPSEMKAFYRIFAPKLFKIPAVHLATNHMVPAIGNPYAQRNSGSGMGAKYTASVRIDMRMTSKMKDSDGKQIGTLLRAVCVKTRSTFPYKEVSFALPFKKPISRYSGLMPLLIECGLVESDKKFLYYDGEQIGKHYKAKTSFEQLDSLTEEFVEQYPEILERADELFEQENATQEPPEEESEDELEDGNEEVIEDEEEETPAPRRRKRR